MEGDRTQVSHIQLHKQKEPKDAFLTLGLGTKGWLQKTRGQVLPYPIKMLGEDSVMTLFIFV
jgi:hypothetical protein